MSETKTFPMHLHVWESIKDDLHYGATVEWTTIEELSEIPRLVHNVVNPKFAFFWMQLEERLQANGFFTTQRGMNERGFRVLHREEIADHVKKKLSQQNRQTKKMVVGMSVVERSGMKTEDEKKLEFMQTKSSFIHEFNQRLLRKQTLPDHASASQGFERLLKERNGN